MKLFAIPVAASLLLASLSGCAPTGADQVETAAAAKDRSAAESKPDPLSPQVAARAVFLKEQAEAQSLAQAQESKPDLTSPQVAAREAVSNKNSVLPEMTVYKSPTCGCCKLWVDHMQKSGFKVSVIETDDLNPIKRKLGVPAGLGSCHTAKVGDYFVEGHVPASDVIRLLKEKPKALGIAVPGMPMGSPGMEVPSGETQPYTVTQVNKDGSLSIFSSHSK